ncbi:MAG: hypothetical protein K0S71_294 [Clostridia bacterium]|jgi:hypothetical protein|nr:hypothetical protein [Clostridia bacterium]
MFNLMEYKSEVEEIIKELSSKDENWDWSISNISESEILINWGYLEYLEEEKPFRIYIDNLADTPAFIAYTNYGEFITFVDARYGITEIIEKLFYYARERY